MRSPIAFLTVGVVLALFQVDLAQNTAPAGDVARFGGRWHASAPVNGNMLDFYIEYVGDQYTFTVRGPQGEACIGTGKLIADGNHWQTVPTSGGAGSGTYAFTDRDHFVSTDAQGAVSRWERVVDHPAAPAAAHQPAVNTTPAVSKVPDLDLASLGIEIKSLGIIPKNNAGVAVTSDGLHLMLSVPDGNGKFAISYDQKLIGTSDENPLPARSNDGRHLLAVVTRNQRVALVADDKIGPEFETIDRQNVHYSLDGSRLAYVGMINRSTQPVNLQSPLEMRYVAVIDGKPGPEFMGIVPIQTPPPADPGNYTGPGSLYPRPIKANESLDTVDTAPLPTNTIFTLDGRHVGYVARVSASPQQEAAVIDGRQGPTYDTVTGMAFSTTGRSAYVARRGRQTWIVIDEVAHPVLGVSTNPLFSNDGKRLAYGVFMQGYATINLDGKEQGQWSSVRDVAMSRDGKRLGFIATIAGTGREVAVVDGVASREYQSVSALSFSPDGAHYKYVGESTNPQGSRIYVDGKAPEVSASVHDNYDDRFTFSPDGTRYMYQATVGKTPGLVLDGRFLPDCERVEKACSGFTMAGVACYDQFDRQRESTVFHPVIHMLSAPGRDAVAAGKGPDETVLGGSADGKLFALAVSTGVGSFILAGQDGTRTEVRCDWHDFRFGPVGSRWAVPSREFSGRMCMVLDGEKGPIFGQILGAPRFSPDGRRAVYWAAEGARRFIVIDGRPGPEFDSPFADVPISVTNQAVDYCAVRSDELFHAHHRLSESAYAIAPTTRPVSARGPAIRPPVVEDAMAQMPASDWRLLQGYVVTALSGANAPMKLSGRAKTNLQLDQEHPIDGLRSREDSASCTLTLNQGRSYELSITYGCAPEADGAICEIDIDGTVYRRRLASTGDKRQYNSICLGLVQRDGDAHLTIRCEVPHDGDGVTISSVSLCPATAERVNHRMTAATLPTTRPGEPSLTINLVFDRARDEDMLLEARRQAAFWYPIICEKLRATDRHPPREFSISLFQADGLDLHASKVMGRTISLDRNWLTNHRGDFTPLARQLALVISDSKQDDQRWLAEGMADYVLYYVIEPGTNPVQVVRPPVYKDSPPACAALLNYIETKYGPGIISKLDALLRKREFYSDTIETLTGKRVEVLWDECYMDSVKKSGG